MGATSTEVSKRVKGRPETSTGIYITCCPGGAWLALSPVRWTAKFWPRLWHCRIRKECGVRRPIDQSHRAPFSRSADAEAFDLRHAVLLDSSFIDQRAYPPLWRRYRRFAHALLGTSSTLFRWSASPSGQKLTLRGMLVFQDNSRDFKPRNILVCSLRAPQPDPCDVGRVRRTR